jgi:hypothetical protein
MKIIIIILICLFFSLTITPINEYITNPLTPQTPTTEPPPQTQTTELAPATPQPQTSSDGSLQTQVNMLSTQMQTTNAMALEAKKKSDDISSQIEQLKKELEKQVDA